MTTFARVATATLLAAFSGLTALAVVRYGYLGFFETLLATLPGWVAATDLVIALSLVLVWMWRDARERGVAVLPYAALTMAFGSVGPLLYLLRRPDAVSDDAARRHAA